MFGLNKEDKMQPMVADKWDEFWAALRQRCQIIGAMEQNSQPMETYRQVAKLVNQALTARFFLLAKYFPEG
jgi:hypothetical protein